MKVKCLHIFSSIMTSCILAERQETLFLKTHSYGYQVCR